MGSNYFIEKGGQTFGPTSSFGLRTLVQAGKLAPTDLIWREGSERKVQAEQVKGLSFASPTVVAPSPVQESVPPVRSEPNKPNGQCEFYYEVGGESQGPVALLDLQELVQQGTVQKETSIWHDGLEDWTPASEVDELVSIFPPTTGKAPPPPPANVPPPLSTAVTATPNVAQQAAHQGKTWLQTITDKARVHRRRITWVIFGVSLLVVLATAAEFYLARSGDPEDLLLLVFLSIFAGCTFFSSLALFSPRRATTRTLHLTVAVTAFLGCLGMVCAVLVIGPHVFDSVEWWWVFIGLSVFAGCIFFSSLALFSPPRATTRTLRLTIAVTTFCVCLGMVCAVAGVGGRDVSSLRSALLGHWGSKEDPYPSYFFSPTSFILLEEGKEIWVPYTIVESEENVNWLKIRVDGEKFTTYHGFRFTPSRKFLEHTLTLEPTEENKEFADRGWKLPTITDRWFYWDSRTKP